MEKLLEELRELDEIDLLELLEITSEDLVQVFRKRIEKRRKYLEEQMAGKKEDERGDEFSLYQEA